MILANSMLKNYDAETSWIDEIIQKVTIKKSEAYHENLYYNQAYTKAFIDIFSSLVLWSRVMDAKYEANTKLLSSSDVESFFNSLKNGILNGEMVHLCEFFKLHTEFINAEVKLHAMQAIGQYKRKRSGSSDGKFKQPGKK